MTTTQLLLIALGVSADAFAVSVVQGTTIREHVMRRILLLSVVFGVFQAVMPLIGWAVGSSVAGFVESIDHWIAFAMLAGIGTKMIVDTVREGRGDGSGGGEGTAPATSFTVRAVLTLGVATSIDALAVGIGFALVPINILVAVGLIGATTFLASLAGGWLGHHGGRRLGRPATFIGGLVLIGIGASILVEHLTA
ncbi:MAG: manganese efflux pump MntP [Corynebacterium sp.]|uniref:manganese efflux pump MntP n=1 Tax=unclassified Corynebacterium TaxID=2624378 RepID=UPI00264A2BD7|nr:manganese efflux pump MntP family protein [Corynebacterium sp.]MDN5581695.1 manganese efflux pump MntP family protein [Corynebacterium sp.]MDN5720443.1 manganese efflux pump MntP family protein [Corynebacterium sp.]MDN6259881.1 manganese efflux pump MntP family protein [Corynebacterium sp.]MDN6324486.1 manganese efflux pump MntP family protein [Corynebacterium sp.]MDN6387812.1 manganese efflux pump MntP family protein [Corynebacterium sp.]